MKIRLKKLNPWMISTFLLGLVLVASFFFKVSLPIISKESPNLGTHSKDQAQAVSVDPAEIHKKIICSCCGKSIADCTCGMAKERRDFVNGLVAKGQEERGVLKEIVKKYGQDVLFDQAYAAEIKEELVAEAPQDRAIILIEPENIDLGQVSIVKGEVEASFKIKNVGQSDLVISGLETSCGCTTAFLTVDGQNSPVFGMSDNPTDWSATLNPDQEAELVAIFDPAHHGPEGVGMVTRTVSIKSSDLIDSFKKIQLEAEVVE